MSVQNARAGTVDLVLDASRYQHLVVNSAIPGRLRVTVRALYRNSGLRDRLESHLSRLPGLKLLRVNDLTGRILIHFQKGVAPEDFLDAVESDLADRGIPERRYRVAADAPAQQSLPEQSIEPVAREKNEAATPDGFAPVQWHGTSARKALAAQGTSLRTGLAEEDVRQRLAQYGPNELPEPATRSRWSVVAGQFNNLPVGLLAASAGVSVLTGGLADALVILGVIAINGAVGYRTEWQAEQTIASLERVSPPEIEVIRDGRSKKIPQANLVPGDLVRFAAGARIGADARLLRSHRLRVDESALTGESAPVRKHAWFKANKDTPLADRANTVHMGTTVTGGSGLALVTSTGRRTAFGEVHRLVGEARPPETPMQRQLDYLGTRLALLSGGVCLGVFGIGLIRGVAFLPMLKSAISLAVAAVPEGLTAVATTTLAMGIRRLGHLNVAIRRLDAVETLGAVETICLDKTGTLTENRMAVVRVQRNGARLEVREGKRFRDNELQDVTQDQALQRLWQIAVLCSDTQVAGDVDDLIGSPTENALVRAAIEAGIDPDEVRSRLPRIDALYRSEGRPYMATFHRQENGRQLVAVKGSPSALLDQCRWHLRDGKRAKLDEATRAQIARANEEMAGDALRVLGFAYGERKDGSRGDLPGLTWLGLAGLADPLRADMAKLMAQFHRAGIRTVMITGDQSATAHAIGRQLNISGGERVEILDSQQLEKLDKELLSGLSRRVHIFARVSPAHKLQIVQAMQEAGLVVAMTGDGINDGPALKAADIGIAMGHSGSDVARSVADVVIEDDNLHTMLIAVSEGRTIYDNVRKAIRYLVSTNLSEIVVMLGGISLGLGQPLSPMQLLWINLITDIFPALALALEPAAPDVLERPPRNAREPIIRRRDLRKMARESALISAAGLASFAYGRMRYGAGLQASGISFHTLAAAQLLHALSARSEHRSIFHPGNRRPNRYLNTAIGVSLAAQIAAGVIPGLRGLLGLGRIGLLDGLVISAGATAPLILNEALKPSRPSHAEI